MRYTYVAYTKCYFRFSFTVTDRICQNYEQINNCHSRADLGVLNNAVDVKLIY